MIMIKTIIIMMGKNDDNDRSRGVVCTEKEGSQPREARKTDGKRRNVTQGNMYKIAGIQVHFQKLRPMGAKLASGANGPMSVCKRFSKTPLSLSSAPPIGAHKIQLSSSKACAGRRANSPAITHQRSPYLGP
jgi:hypothetical protein